MTAQLLGSTTAAPPPVAPPTSNGVEPRIGLNHKLTAEDGTVWDISTWETGVYLIQGTVEGLGMPEVVNWKTTSPAVDGHQWDGYLVPGRKVFFYLAVWHNGSAADWAARNDELWDMFYPGKLLTWTVQLPGSNRGARHLQLRYEKCEDGFETDPTFEGWAVYGLELSPEQPFWEGEPITRELQQQTVQDFFTGGAGSPFYISGEQSIGSATMDNPGTAPSYILWEVVGPTTSVTVGVNGGTTTFTPDIAAGDVLVIDTDPRNLGAELEGVDVTGQLGSFDYRPIPPGKDISLDLAMAGSGTIRATFTPRYWRCI